MMGRTHAWTGAAAGAGLSIWFGLGAVPTAGAVLVCAGSALLPDLDHHSSIAANCCGPISREFARLVCWLSGGHRRGTHSLVGCLMLAGIAAYGMVSRDVAFRMLKDHNHSSYFWFSVTGTVVLGWLLVLVFAGIVRLVIGYPPGMIDDLLPIPLALAVIKFGGTGLTWVPVAIGVGCLIHIAGDMLTPEGCPLLWPLINQRYALGLFTTNTWPERWLVAPVVMLATGALLADHAGLVAIGGL